MKWLSCVLEEAELEYEHHPRLVFVSFLVLVYILILLQSFLALPRPLTTVFKDTWEMLLLIIPVSYIVIKPTQRILLIVGWAFIAAGVARAFFGFPHFIKPEYATLFSVSGIWLVGEWFNYRTFKKTLLTDLLSGNYYIAGGLILSTVFLGAVVEFLNAPVALWWYRWPFPSVEIMGMPVFLAAIGWFPWILSIFVFFYPLSILGQKKIKGLRILRLA